MNKYLIMTAAAIFGTAAPALSQDPAKITTIQFMSTTGSTLCDGLSLYKSKYSRVDIELGQHLQSGCGEQDVEIAGVVHKATVDMVQDWNNLQGISYLYEISTPIQNGGTWVSWYCTDGKDCIGFGTGTYKLGYGGDARGRPKSTAKLDEITSARNTSPR